MDDLKILTVGDLKKFLAGIPNHYPVCGTDTGDGVVFYRFYFDSVSVDKSDEKATDYGACKRPGIPGPVVILDGVVLPEPISGGTA